MANTIIARLKPIKSFLSRQRYQLPERLKALRRAGARVLASPLQPYAGICALTERLEFTPELVIMNYCQGRFPLGRRSGSIEWDDPDPRGVLFVRDFHAPKRVQQYAKNKAFDIRTNTAFREVMLGCAERSVTWISPTIIAVYGELHAMGIAHSIEAWQDGQLVGGGFGISIGGMFALESLFYRVSQASKVAILSLAELLKANHIEFIDCQYASDHMMQFGAIPVPREDYKKLLARAIIAPVRFDPHALVGQASPPA